MFYVVAAAAGMIAGWWFRGYVDGALLKVLLRALTYGLGRATVAEKLANGLLAIAAKANDEAKS